MGFGPASWYDASHTREEPTMRWLVEAADTKTGEETEITVEATVPPAETNNYSIYIVDAGTGKALKEHRVKANRGTIRRTFKSDLAALTIIVSTKPALTEFTTAADVLLASAPQPPQ